MSTKIYNAYITDAPYSKVLKQAKKLREKTREAWRYSVGSFMTLDVNRNLIRENLSTVLEVNNSIARGYRVLNPTCSLVLYAHPKDGRLIVHCFGIDDAKVEKAFLRSIAAKDYHFQNQCDKDERITEAQWRERERAWDSILSGSGVPSENGFVFDLIDAKSAVEIALSKFHEIYPPESGWANGGGPDIAAMFSATDLLHAAKTETLKEWTEKIVTKLSRKTPTPEQP